MGHLLDGVWREDFFDHDERGRFVRQATRFHSWITPDGAAGPTGEAGFKAEPGRYHLYVSLACPWAHRTLIFRKLKKLDDLISVSIVDPVMGAEGWAFSHAPGAIPDTVEGKERLSEIYLLTDPKYTGRVTVPVLWDKQKKTIVNNESSEIIRMLNSAFDALTPARTDYCPKELRPEIDEINTLVYETVNNGVYRTGFATTQEAYEEAFRNLFATLDKLEERLSRQRYLVDNRLTEADWRLFTTLIRFDAVYFGHFKCNLRRIADYPNLSNYLRDLYQVPGVAGTVNLAHIKTHYYASHRKINPTGIVPLGPELDFAAPHDRARFDKPAVRAAR
ncbi:MAG: glutathione S-transferase family protein [Burkholderiales bacterium]|nr:glutathione S-transferase family protein [Burkholderiales bacterium]